MRELDMTVAYDLRDLSDEQLNVFLNWLIKNDKNWGRQTINNLKVGRFLHFNILDEEWVLYRSNADVVNALTLFETQFKQGDKVLVRNLEDEDWIEKVYVVEYNGDHYVKSDYESCLISFKYIKPYEDEKKWYVVGRGLDAYYSVLSEDEVLWSRAEDKRVEEITDSEFIKHLDANAN